MEVGDVKGTAQVTNGVARVCADGLSATNDIAAFELRGGASGGGDLGASFVFTPKNAGNLACVAQWGGNVNVRLSLVEQSVKIAVAVEPVPTTAQTLKLGVTMQSQDLTLKTVPPPIVAILTQNPHAFLVCAPARGAASLSSKLREDLIKDTFQVPLPTQHFEVPVEPVEVAIGEKKFNLVPGWGEKVILFTVR